MNDSALEALERGHYNEKKRSPKAMTFKPEDCPCCRNSGIVRYAISSNTALVDSRYALPPALNSFETSEKPCDCHYGQEYEIWLNRIRHPEYENPLLGMTDEQLIHFLSRQSDDQRARQQAIDSEFKV